MTDAGEVQRMADEVAALMAERLRIGGRGLEAKLRRGGRALPRRIRQEAQLLARAAAGARAPKILHQMDHARIAAAHAACVAHLRPLGAAGRRWAALRNFAASVSLAGIATFAMVVGVLVWRGYL